MAVTKQRQGKKMSPAPMTKKRTVEDVQAEPGYNKLPPAAKLAAMLRVKNLDALVKEGHVFNARTFGERVGYSYDHVRRLCRAGKIIPLPIMHGQGKVWKEYYFLPEHLDAIFAAR